MTSVEADYESYLVENWTLILHLKEQNFKLNGGTDTIPIFPLQTHETQDFNKHFEHCVENDLFKMKHYESLVGDVTKKEFSMRPEFEIIGEESSGRADYAIKIQRSILKGYAQNIKRLESSHEMNKKRKRDDNDFKYLYRIITSPGKISQTSEVPLTIEFNKKALDKGSEEHQTLCNGVKKILGAINVPKGRVRSGFEVYSNST
ncbi:hypothetical protein RhiirA4_419098 [Rhizophagus irregularis]|uniref:Uncharacterized protein n=1 Tax=Rhizophagus irregularis TaxID=588596 RepID=A0A2I1GCZ3_9GLOM|nr:hypothetical protein RhiirA4_419098 [Rhizophagus irregularis]